MDNIMFSSFNMRALSGQLTLKDMRNVDKWAKKAEERIKRCKHPSHNPPMHKYYPPGHHEHECSACGYITKFLVPEIIL